MCDWHDLLERVPEAFLKSPRYKALTHRNRKEVLQLLREMHHKRMVEEKITLYDLPAVETEKVQIVRKELQH